MAAKLTFRIQVSLRVPEYHIPRDIVIWGQFSPAPWQLTLLQAGLPISHYPRSELHLLEPTQETQSGESRRERKERVEVIMTGEERMKQAASYSCWGLGSDGCIVCQRVSSVRDAGLHLL